MTRGLRRRDLLAGSGAALGLGAAAGVARRTAVAAVAGGRLPRWGIAVDLARCASQAGCRQCIDACHATHRIPAVADPRHEIKWVWKEPFARVFPEQLHGYEAEAKRLLPALVLCNHCGRPPCTKVCPTGATWRRTDGVVAMDAHRCIGCRYCMAACPYGARSFNWEKPTLQDAGGSYPARTSGVVEKCTLCVERLDVGRAPLCVETCARGPKALVFGDLEDSSSPIRHLLATRQVLRRRAALGTEPSVFYLVA